jgi:hypothetical protein
MKATNNTNNLKRKRGGEKEKNNKTYLSIENLCDPHLLLIIKHCNHHQNNNTTMQS